MSLSQFIWHIKYVEKQDDSVISFFYMKCRSAPAGWKPHFLSASGTILAPSVGCAGSICAAAQKIAKMSTKKAKKSGQCPLNA